MTSRRARPTPEQRLSRAFQFVPGHVGGRVASAQPIRRRGGTLRQASVGAVAGDGPRYWTGSWTGATMTVPSGPEAGDLVVVVVAEAVGDNDYFDDPAISATWDSWASRGYLTFGSFTHDGRSSYTISTEAAGGAFAIVRNGTIPGGYDNLLDEGSTGSIAWYGDSGGTFTLSGTEQAHLVLGWAAEDYDAPADMLGVVVVDPATSPVPSPMHSIANPLAGSDYWYAAGALVKSTA